MTASIPPRLKAVMDSRAWVIPSLLEVLRLAAGRTDQPAAAVHARERRARRL